MVHSALTTNAKVSEMTGSLHILDPWPTNKAVLLFTWAYPIGPATPRVTAKKSCTSHGLLKLGNGHLTEKLGAPEFHWIVLSTVYRTISRNRKPPLPCQCSLMAKKTGLPASFMVSQSWKGSLHEKKERFLKKLDSSCHRKLFDQLYQCELWYVKSVVMTAYG